MLNSVSLVGRAGNDPDIKVFNSGHKLAELRMAINRPGKEQGKQETDWFDIKIWGKSADIAEQYVKKGHIFGVIGELQVEKWEHNGNQRSKVVVNAHNLRLMQPKEQQPQQEQQQEQTEADIFDGAEATEF
ncbi:MAG: single-stranded DNA-binding protein [Patescibacteria group bacterium]|nr:single-stranded DNA-binding protein [Patescibacteria group bacterium]